VEKSDQKWGEFSFEGAYRRLEEILKILNSGGVSLEKSLELYEEAVHLISLCEKRLNDAEQKIEILIKNREGNLSLDVGGNPEVKPFTPEAREVLKE